MLAQVSTEPIPIEVAALFGLMGTFLVLAGLPRLVRAVRLYRTIPVRVGQLGGASGTVLLTGTARRGEATVQAPLSGRECLAYTYRVVGRRTSLLAGGGARSGGYEVASGRDAAPFLLDDGTGEVEVVAGDRVGLQLTEEVLADSEADLEELRGARGWLHRLPVPFEVSQAEQFYEGRLDDGETVVVRGRVRRDGSRVRADGVSVLVGGVGSVIADAAPRSAARRALAASLLSVGLGLALLGLLAFLLGVL